GTYPGAEGLDRYRGRQADRKGVEYPGLPLALGRDGKPDPRFPADLPNAPFPLQKYVAPFDPTNNPVHRFYHMQRQYAAGADAVAMGKWVAEGTSGGTSMGFFDRYASPVQWKLADEFVLLDHWFQGVHGGSFANHFYLISAGLARYPDAPAEVRAVGVGPDGRVEEDGDGGPRRAGVNQTRPPRCVRSASARTVESRRTATSIPTARSSTISIRPIRRNGPAPFFARRRPCRRSPIASMRPASRGPGTRRAGAAAPTRCSEGSCRITIRSST